jgi:Rrf2 family cysteine metabolism transcriptional repressor
MKLSTRTRYAVRAIIELAHNEGNQPLQLRVIAKRQDISIKYLEQLIAVLRSAGLVRSIRGSKGGYVLAKEPSQIKLSDVFHCLEGNVNTAECIENKDYCERAAECAARQVWAQVQQAIEDVLQSITLQDLVDNTKNDKNLNYQI